MRPHYLPREFTHVIVIAAYIPPSANAEEACDVISSTPVPTRTVKKWSEEALKDCADTTAWDVFTDSHGENINGLTDCITDDMNFCEENVVPTRIVRFFPTTNPGLPLT
ncbi:hypothetical protein JOQ06_002890 [Pogonophryne albipinna]|uniref:Uncharacterized protein n=1 Tax=Pogonophryne albipinna TaxID=1090488 RepID=A0AAD6FM29_9TELE|nr:hypothetical protein JOQ06_002890 [Pogonophryne albipinna]